MEFLETLGFISDGTPEQMQNACALYLRQMDRIVLQTNRNQYKALELLMRGLLMYNVELKLVQQSMVCLTWRDPEHQTEAEEMCLETALTAGMVPAVERLKRLASEERDGLVVEERYWSMSAPHETIFGGEFMASISRRRMWRYTALDTFETVLQASVVVAPQSAPNMNLWVSNIVRTLQSEQALQDSVTAGKLSEFMLQIDQACTTTQLPSLPWRSSS